MKQQMLPVVVFLLSSLILCGCTSNAKSDEEILPDVSYFSSENYENYEWIFPEIENAAIYHDGKCETILPNDPRLIRLLNALCYSYNHDLCAWRQGAVEHNEIVEYLESDLPILDINFLSKDKHGDDQKRFNTTRLVVCANGYLRFIDPQNVPWMDNEKMYAEICFPFAENLHNKYLAQSEELADTVRERNCVWGENEWIDLLVYAGFEV